MNNAMPKVSVIMPSYNTAALIGEALDSVFAQSYRDFEVIVINDGSPDTPDLERVLDPYRERILYLKQENRRACGARNNGISHAKGEYLTFLTAMTVGPLDICNPRLSNWKPILRSIWSIATA